MNIPSVRLLRAAALLGLVISAPSRADWALSTDLSAVRPLPDFYTLQSQNPPGISWSRYPSATDSTAYVVILNSPSGKVTKTVVNRNWYLPTAALTEVGTYTWQVAPFTRTAAMKDLEASIRSTGKASGTLPATIDANVITALLPLALPLAKDWSILRSFTMDKTAPVFEVPEAAAMSAAVLSHPRPRQLQPGFPTTLKWTSAMTAERGAAVTALVSDVTSRIGVMAPVKDSDWLLSGPVTAALTAQNTDIRLRISRTGHQLEAAALLYYLKKDDPKGPVYLAEALARGDELAALNPYGPTSYANQDQGTRVIALSLAKAIDTLGDSLDSTRRAKWLSVINLRTADIYADLAGSNGRMDQYPYDSHGGNTLGFVALISVLTLGDIPAAQSWFDFSVRTYIHQVFAWSGPEGGYANGTAYGQVAADYSLQIWDPLAQATGVNLYRKPWSTGFAQFFAQFVPPGARTHVFGDGHEDVPNPNLLKAFASRFATPWSRWYYLNLAGTEDPVTLLLAPSPLPVNTISTVTPPPNASMYPSIGWVSMHSDLGDRMRTSLFFKSGPYGAYNHSHADQNGIVLTSAGNILLKESGYYDWYGSPLWLSWYRATKAHNAITYSTTGSYAGVGQGTDGNNINLTRVGKITAFTTSAALDYAEGDATPAYEGALSLAKRKIWYFRPKNVYVVMDSLAAPTDRSFEWNFHTPFAINGTAASATIVNGTSSLLCITPLTKGVGFVKPIGFPTLPTGSEDHAAFTLPVAKTGEFLMVLDVGCSKPVVSLTPTASGRVLKVGDQSITLPSL